MARARMPLLASWDSPDWRWGYANGAAHDVAMAVRSRFDGRPARARLLADLRSAEPPPLDDVKMVLSLAWQRARNYGYDNADWEGAMEQMAACAFEGEGGPARLAEAIRLRLGNTDAADASLETLAALSLESLQFEARGL